MSFTIEEAKQVLSQKFLLQEGVAGVSHHSSEIVVYVESEEYAERIPRTLLGYPVKVVVSGRFRILAGYEARTARVRPVVGGVSAGSTLTTAGTVACTVVDRLTGLRMLLSNRHVFDGPAGTPILQPGAVDGGVYPDDVVAAVERFIEVKPPPDINLVDACVAMPVSQDIVGYEVLGLGVPNGVGEARVGERIRKSGRSCGVSEAVVVDTNATVKVEGYSFGEAIFEDTVITTFCGVSGDSGSIGVSAGTNVAIGLLFAGSEKLTCFNKMSNVVRLLEVDIPRYGVAGYQLVPSAAYMFAQVAAGFMLLLASGKI